jgi:Uma2 family endonuclease
MAESEINLEQMIDLILTLRSLLAPHGHHVGGNLLTYWNPANGNEHIAPDVFVALDAGPARRRTWLVWEDGKFPEVVFEIASPSTRNRDLGPKVTLHGRLGAREYYIFDPLGRLNPIFRGYARRGGALARVPNPTGASISSALLGLESRVVDGWLRVIDPATGQQVPTVEEEREGLRAEAEARATQEAQARQEAEARAAQAEARLAALKAQMARRDEEQDDGIHRSQP